MKGLIIAYSFYPSKSVAAIRTTYWAEQMVAEHECEIDVISANEGKGKHDFKHIHVEHKSTSFLKKLIYDEGMGWKKDILTYFKINKPEKVYDFVIISGGPFLHFDIGRKLKKKGIVKKIILDYRDPFSFNPRFQDPKFKIAIKKLFEVYLNFGADLILSVNSECLRYITNISSAKKLIIPNGYDERYFKNAQTDNQKTKKLVYPGKFYWHPSEFFEVLKNMQLEIAHVGSQINLEKDKLNTDLYKYEGFISQDEIPNFLSTGEVGVIFLSEVPFESTTKIFDYLALNMKVLVITRGDKKVGAMADILDAYPNVVWANETKKDIEIALNILLEMEAQSVDTEMFSRKNALHKLMGELNAIN